MKNFTFATIAAAVVSSLATLLLTIGARSPYTHANLLPQFDPQYTRTEQAAVGPPAPYRGPGLATSALATADLASRGKTLLVSRGCASCHGLEGRGGVVGPPILGFDSADLWAKTNRGPSAMPAYGAEALTADDLEALAAFLASPTASVPKAPVAAAPTAASTPAVAPSPTATVLAVPKLTMAAAPTSVGAPVVAPSPKPAATAGPTAVGAPVVTPSPKPAATAAPAAAGAPAAVTCAGEVGSEVCRIRVDITDNGFNNVPTGFEIGAKQGQLVELTFVFAQTRFPRDSHAIVLSGYELQTEQIDSRHRQATLKFVAEKAGRFVLKCELECDIHRKLRDAYLVIR